MQIKKHIPNLITCGNLFCGCVAIILAFSEKLEWTAYLVGIAIVLDFLDGFAARMLGVHSEMGKQLDSLADMVTFGVVPGIVMFQLLSGSFLSNLFVNMIKSFLRDSSGDHQLLPEWSVFLAFLITIFSAVRLAKFNIDSRQSDSFIGLPTPANAMLICSLPLILVHQREFFGIHVQDIILNPLFLFALIFILSFLLVAELPLFALKFKNFKWGGNELRFIFLGLAVLLLILFQYIGIPFIIFLYIILSIINNIINRKKHEIAIDTTCTNRQ